MDVHEFFLSHTMVMIDAGAVTDAVADGGNMHVTTSEHVDGGKECENVNVQVSSEGEAESVGGDVDSGINEEEPQARYLGCELEHSPGGVSSSGHHMTDSLSQVPSSSVLPSAHNHPPIGLDVIAIGPGALDKDGNQKPVSISPGSSVMYSKYSGSDFKGSDGSNYIVLKSSDVLAIPSLTMG
ncbi:hypothetical protein Drorol1_Dr00015913 [Drosera rotundifolia]